MTPEEFRAVLDEIGKLAVVPAYPLVAPANVQRRELLNGTRRAMIRIQTCINRARMKLPPAAAEVKS